MSLSSIKTVGVIGLGQMGLPMASNLARKGFRVLGHDINPLSPQACARIGVEFTKPSRLWSEAEVVLLSLPTEKILRSLALDPQGFASGPVRGRVVIDTTTATVALAKEIAAACSASDGAYLDAPVTGGVYGAEQGSLSVMCGGEAADFDRALPVLQAIGSNLVHVGPSGCGQAAKMVNQLLMAAIYVSVAESFAFAAKLGADVEKVYQAVEHGGARSNLLSGIKANLLAGVTQSIGNVDQHGKDVDYALDEANRIHHPLPLAAAVQQAYHQARALGCGHLWSGELWAAQEKILGIKLTDTIRGRKRLNPDQHVPA